MSTTVSFGEGQDELKNQFIINPNENYNVTFKEEDLYQLDNCAENIIINNVGNNSMNANSIEFVIDTGSVFTDRNINIQIDPIAIDFRRRTATTGANKVDANNFVTEFFNNYGNIAFKPYGILNCIDSVSITLDNMILTVDKPAECLKLTAPYADKSVVFEKVECSLPDITDYTNYKLSDTTLKSLSLDGTSTVHLPPNLISNMNPFGQYGDINYNSRIPVFSFVGSSDDKLHATIKTEPFNLQIPFSLFSLPGEEAPPLVGVKKINIKFQFKTEFHKHLFSVVPNTEIEYWELVNFRGFSGTASIKNYTAPAYINETYNLYNKIPSYAQGAQTVTHHLHSQNIRFTAAERAKTVNSMVFNLSAIPKTVYIAVKRSYENDVNRVKYLPETYARIKSLKIEMDGKQTDFTFPNSDGLYNMCKKNGLSFNREVACYMSGFPLKFDVSNDLANKNNCLVGSITVANNAFKILSMDVENLNVGNATDYEVQVMFVYDSLITYNSGNFRQYQTLINYHNDLNINMHNTFATINYLRGHKVVGGSIGSFLVKFGPMLAKIAKGAYKTATNKDFHRILKENFADIKSKPKQIEDKSAKWNMEVEPTPVVTGEGFRKSPAFGGNHYNVTGGADIGRFNY